MIAVVVLSGETVIAIATAPCVLAIRHDFLVLGVDVALKICGTPEYTLGVAAGDHAWIGRLGP